MYVVVDMGVDNKILWSDSRICTTKKMAHTRTSFMEQKNQSKNYHH